MESIRSLHGSAGHATATHAHSEHFIGRTGLVPGPTSGYFASSNFLGGGPTPSTSAFSHYGRPLGTGRSFSRPTCSYSPSGDFLGREPSPSSKTFDLSDRGPVRCGFLRSNGEARWPPPVLFATYEWQRAESGYTHSEHFIGRTGLARGPSPGHFSSSDFLSSSSISDLSEYHSSRSGSVLGADRPDRPSGTGHGSDPRPFTPVHGPRRLSGVNDTASNANAESCGLRAPFANQEINRRLGDSTVARLFAAGADAGAKPELRGAEASSSPATATGGSAPKRESGDDQADDSVLALEQRVEEACALVERCFRERQDREELGKEIQRKEEAIRRERARKKREADARELE